MKNIILLSDGTGNSAAKRHRTNVWRLYQALDVHRDDQIAFYDDGVGSQQFRLFKILGGAFGWGLKNNVLELYKTLCRTYKANDDDKIYLFGFSRGAFTVRMLAGMIAHCGLYTAYKDEKDLRKTARGNFAAYRSRYKRGLLIRLIRWLLRKRSSKKGNVTPEIEFIGVWDTVDAYGLPLDELAVLWDWLIFPLRFVDHKLPDNVRRACHALSIDDERHTFHPVLWDEREETSGCIEQVWFAGVHTDVGGGYPRRELALVTLDWMISKVEAPDSKVEASEEKVEASEEKPELHFIPAIRNEYKDQSDWHGMQHDSRSGVAAYYRYKPREIEQLCNEVSIAKPKIHRGVLERIQQNIVPYAPTVLPADYKVVATRGSVPNRILESSNQATDRANAMKAAHDVVFWRRWLYAAFLVATAIFALSPLLFPWSEDGACDGWGCIADPLLRLAIYALPDFAAPWIEVLRQNPLWLVGVLIASLVLVRLKIVAARATQACATTAWAELKGKGKPPVLGTPSRTTKLRSFLHVWPWSYIRCILPAILFVAILVLLLSAINRTVFFLRATFGQLCHPTTATELQKAEPVSFQIDNPCFATGIKLKKGIAYRFEVETSQKWGDGDISANADGIDNQPLILRFFALFRRHISEPWLKLMGRVGQVGNETFVIGSGPTEYKAKSDGELFLYVNDAVFGLAPGRYRAWPYFWSLGENEVEGTITVSPVP